MCVAHFTDSEVFVETKIHTISEAILVLSINTFVRDNKTKKVVRLDHIIEYNNNEIMIKK
jgi:hypothetical protein